MTNILGVAHAPTTDFGQTMYRFKTHNSTPRDAVRIEKYTEASNQWNDFVYRHVVDSVVGYRKLGEAVTYVMEMYDVEIERVVLDPSLEDIIDHEDQQLIDENVEYGIITHLTEREFAETIGLDGPDDPEIDFSQVTLIDCQQLVDEESEDEVAV